MSIVVEMRECRICACTSLGLAPDSIIQVAQDVRTIFARRRSNSAWTRRKQHGVQVAERVIEFIDAESPDATVIDADGLGSGVFDQLKHRNYGARLHEFHGGGRPEDVNKYFNRRAEVWGLMRDWLNAAAEIPDDPELATDLTGPQYNYSPKQQLQLERKEVMKGRGLASPDSGDTLAMTFAVRVAARQRPQAKLIYSFPNQSGQRWMSS